MLEHFKLARRYGITFSLVMADIDYFKEVKDTYGHLAGDLVLRRVSGVEAEAIRETDHAGRYGGEELLIILASTDRNRAVQVSERIRRNVETLKSTNEDGRSMPVTISLGVAQYQADEHLDALIERDDRALYRAKQKGRNRTEC